MLKQAMAGVVGLLAVTSGVLAFFNAAHACSFLKQPPLLTTQRILFSGLICLTAGAVAVQFLRYSYSGESTEKEPISMRHAALAGIGCFFPGFFLSLPLTMAWADLTWPGDGQASLAAVPVSFVIGAITAVTAIILLTGRASQQN
jgi:hypothetical protein